MDSTKGRALAVIAATLIQLVITSCTGVAGQNPDVEYSDTEVISEEAPDITERRIDYEPEPRDVISFKLSSSALHEFLKGPTIDALWETSEVIVVFRKSRNLYWDIESIRVFPSGDSLEYAESGIYRLGAWPVYTEFIDFMNEPENFVKILAEHDIDEEILDIAVICHPNSRGGLGGMCIWIHTDGGDYFLEDYLFPDGDPHDTTFTYLFHDLAGYSNKY